jgi:hypothetical protein
MPKFRPVARHFLLVIPSPGEDEGPLSRKEDHARAAFAIHEDRSGDLVAVKLCDFLNDCEVPRRLRGSG